MKNKKCFKKIILLISLIVLQRLNCFADPSLSLLKKLKVIETKYFDIIYCEESQNTAFALANNCDSLYEKAAAVFGEETKMHFPVTVVPGTQVINAHYNPVPYAHIVVYDTVSTNYELANTKESLIEIFYHELVHAVSMNIRKSKDFQVTARIIGDFMAAPNIQMTTALCEGATVSLESKEGFGRLNNGYTLNYILQSKIENKFPDYYEFHGGRDIYPKGKVPYMFGGAFAQFLQEKYGMEKYALLWSTEEHMLMDNFFKDAYGKYINNEWKNFENSIPLPELAEETAVKRINEEKGSYKGLVYSRNKNLNGYIYYSQYDESLYFTDSVKTKRLCTLDTSVIDINISQDETKLFITMLAADNSETYCTRIFDLDKQKLLGRKIDNYLLTQDFTVDGKNYLTGISFTTSDTEIIVYDAETFTKEKSIPLKHFCEIYDICEIQKGFAFIYKEEGKWSLCCADCSNGLANISFTNYSFPEKIIPLSVKHDRKINNKNEYEEFTLSVTGKSFIAEDENLPGAMIRLAKVKLGQQKDAEICFQKTDVSGSVLEAVECEDKYAFISRMYEWYYVSCFTEGIPGGLSEAYEMPKINLSVEADENTKNVTLNSKYKTNSNNGVKQFFKRATLIPSYISFMPVATLFANRMVDTKKNLGLGLTSLNGLPGENLFSLFGAGYNPFNKIIGANFSIFGGTKNLSFSAKTGLEFLLTDFVDYYAIGGIFGSRPLINRDLSFEYLFNSTFEMNKEKETSLVNEVLFDLKYLKLTDSGPFSYISSTSYLIWNNSINFKDNKYFIPEGEYEKVYIGNIGVGQSLHFPQLLPVKNPWGLTVNLPFTVSAELIPSNEIFFNCGAIFVLFAKELQCQTGDFPFYLQKVYFTAGAKARWCDNLEPMSIMNVKDNFARMNEMKKQFAYTGGAHLLFALQIGPLSSIQLDCGVDVSIYALDEVNNKKFSITLFNALTF